MKTEPCPVCLSPAQRVSDEDRKNIFWWNCPRCGEFKISRTACGYVTSLACDSAVRTLVSFAVRQMTLHGEWPTITYSTIENVRQNVSLPKADEQAVNFLAWLGQELNAPEDTVLFDLENVRSIIGTATRDGVSYVLNHLKNEGLIRSGSQGGQAEVGLTFKGWTVLADLHRGPGATRTAFMAMKFNDRTLENVYATCFKPAVRATGFELRNLAENPPAGLIDNRMRVEIRKSRFLIADLTHGSFGAYWEAGFAEGLGKPVIYTCERSTLEAEPTHFDTNHHHTVLWDVETLNAVAEDLKATIRATLPTEAVMEDD